MFSFDVTRTCSSQQRLIREWFGGRTFCIWDTKFNQDSKEFWDLSMMSMAGFTLQFRALKTVDKRSNTLEVSQEALYF